MEILEQYAIPIVMAICFGLGFVLKHAITKLPNNWIPVILVAIGIIVNAWIERWTMTPEILLGGIASGLLSIGLFEAGYKGFAGIGVEEPIKNIVPEWVGKISIDDANYYLIYLVSNNDSVVQIYVPEKLVEKELLEWLSEQDIYERKDGGLNDDKCGMPF